MNALANCSRKDIVFGIFVVERDHNLYAYDAPNIKYELNNVNVSGVVFPIPADEINAGFGVEQTPNWEATRPQK